jgi:DNA-binding transcriptional regulator YdaS (Cro superfamily)
MSDTAIQPEAPAFDARPLLEEAVRIAGSQGKLGRKCGVSQASIWTAIKEGRPSAELAIKIEAATGVKARDMRPDLPWPPVDGAPADADRVPA